MPSLLYEVHVWGDEIELKDGEELGRLIEDYLETPEYVGEDGRVSAEFIVYRA